MADLDVAEADPYERIHLFADGRHGLEELLRVFDCHVEHVCDRLALELDLERFAVVALSTTGFAGHVYVRQEVHLDLDDAVALAGLAPPALDVEAEPPGLVTARLGLRKPGEPVADRCEGAGVGRGVGPGCPANRSLVDVDDLVEVLKPLDRVAGSWRLAGPVQAHRGRLEERFDGKSRLPAARDSGHADEFAQREFGVDAFQVVPDRIDDLELLLVAFPPCGRHRNLSAS